MMLSPSLIWFLIGVAFLVSEWMIPGFIMVFFTLGSWIVAIIVGFFDVRLTGQIVIFVAASLILLFSLRKYGLKTFKGSTRADVDDDYAANKIGKTALVTQTIAPHLPGEIKVMGSFWRAVANVEIEAGQSVSIESQESGDGLTFKVKPL